MATDTVADLFAGLLGVGTLAVVAASLVPKLRSLLGQWGAAIAAVVALGATSGSLYFSEVAGFDPCDMCWIQRIFMYPLAIILPIAAVRRDRSVFPYALALAVIGLGFSLNHIRIQLMPPDSTSCDPFNPCSSKWVEALGFASIPMMAGLSFALVLVTLTLQLRATR